jgi:hypothetical protein
MCGAMLGGRPLGVVIAGTSKSALIICPLNTGNDNDLFPGFGMVRSLLYCIATNSVASQLRYRPSCACKCLPYLNGMDLNGMNPRDSIYGQT